MVYVGMYVWVSVLGMCVCECMYVFMYVWVSVLGVVCVDVLGPHAVGGTREFN